MDRSSGPKIVAVEERWPKRSFDCSSFPQAIFTPVYTSKDCQRKIKPDLLICLQFVCLFIVFILSNKTVQLQALTGFIALCLWASLDSRIGSALNNLGYVLENLKGIIVLRTHIQLGLRVTRL